MPGKPGRPPLERAALDGVKKRKSVTDEGFIDTKQQILGNNETIEEDGELKKVYKKKGFSWDQYLSEECGVSAPAKLFKNV